jgi:cellulose synthase/poly-beta-1,6-N-acetylglucosamine synthase-like glycosyltransferase
LRGRCSRCKGRVDEPDRSSRCIATIGPRSTGFGPPFFSIITATHLRPALLARNLRSLCAQTFQDFEVIVVADALDGGTAAICAELRREQDVPTTTC